MAARVGCIGECMVELRELPSGLLQRSWGGDTLNTAVYLARLGVCVDYVTALGDDGWSDEMLAAWQAEGIGTSLVQRLPGSLPGLYIIQTDPGGERRFQYWRDSAAARRLFHHLDPAALAPFDVLYISGITLSIFDDTARAVLIEALTAARARGARIAFDTNFRPRGWPDRMVARRLYTHMFGLAHIVLASAEDLSLLFGPAGQAELLRYGDGTEIVLKLDQPESRLFYAGAQWQVQAAPRAGSDGHDRGRGQLRRRLPRRPDARCAARRRGACWAPSCGSGRAASRRDHSACRNAAAAPADGGYAVTEPSRQEQLASILALGRVIPVITINRLADAVPLARALVEGGIVLLEITLRTEAGMAAAQAIIRDVPAAVVGLGTVLTPDDLARAVDIGARFALSPGATPTLLDAAARAPIPFLPGIATASELMEAMARGFTTAKFFPATAAGGLPGLRALAGPFPQARFCPTGGITEDNAAEWLAQPNVVAVGGSWLTPASEIAAGHWNTLRDRARRTRTRLEGAAAD